MPVATRAKLVKPLAALCLCLMIVPGFEAVATAAAVVSEDVPVPGGRAALAQALGIEPVPDRARFMSEITRLVYETPEIRNPSAAAFLQTIRLPPGRFRRIERVDPRTAERVPIPLTADVWSDAIFRRPLSREEIVTAIIADRLASLVCHGLLALDDETLAYFAGHPSLLVRLYERHAPVFAGFAGGLRIRDNRVVPPGGAEAVALWEAVVGEKVTRVERFVTDLLGANEGRLAYLYDTIGKLDPGRRAFVLGLWIPDATRRLERFKALATVGISGIREWNIRSLPFGRASFDIAMLLARIDVGPDGTPAPPASAALWSKILGSGLHDDAQIDAGWLAEAIVGADVRQRLERLDQIAFAQRVFSRAGDEADVVYVVRSLPRHRALLLTLDRMGIRKPAIYAAAIRHAARLAPFEGRRGFILEAQFQGVLALLAHMTAVGTFDVTRAERFLERLTSTAVADDGRYAGRIAAWLQSDVRPLLPAERNAERAFIAGLAGSQRATESAVRVAWEGQVYRLDLAAAERRRLQLVRERQEQLPFDVPLQLVEAARLLASEKATLDDVEALIAQITALTTDLPVRSREEEADNVPAGVPIPPSTHDILRKTNDELSRALRSKDLKRAARASEPLVELADDMLARVLLSFAYAIHVGDPDGAVLLADDVSHRHDFGFGMRDPEMRGRVRWSIPRQEVAPNVPWHVTGSLLGLDVALASLSLRRVATDRALEAPKLTSNARETFAASVSLLNALALDDGDRDRIAAAIDSGRDRLARVSGAAAIDAIADELNFDGRRRRELRWTEAHEAQRLPLMLSLTEMMALGGERSDGLDAWGMAVLATTGCLCSRVMAPGWWPMLAGRPQLGLAAAVLPDLNFHVAIMLRDLGLPAPLAKVVLSAAMQDFIDEVRPTDDGDWLTLSRAARAVTRERIEDYVAAATATGPLMPDVARSPADGAR